MNSLTVDSEKFALKVRVKTFATQPGIA